MRLTCHCGHKLETFFASKVEKTPLQLRENPFSYRYLVYELSFPSYLLGDLAMNYISIIYPRFLVLDIVGERS